MQLAHSDNTCNQSPILLNLSQMYNIQNLILLLHRSSQITLYSSRDNSWFINNFESLNSVKFISWIILISVFLKFASGLISYQEKLIFEKFAKPNCFNLIKSLKFLIWQYVYFAFITSFSTSKFKVGNSFTSKSIRFSVFFL